MTPIKVLCLECNKSFEFQHPSISNARGLSSVTIDCQSCGAILRVAEHHIVMESLHTQMRRSLVPVIGKEEAEKAQFEVLDLPVMETPKTYSGLPNAPLAQNDELAALRDRLAREATK